MGYKVERKSLSTIDFESAEADMGYKVEKVHFNLLNLSPLKRIWGIRLKKFISTY